MVSVNRFGNVVWLVTPRTPHLAIHLCQRIISCSKFNVDRFGHDRRRQNLPLGDVGKFMNEAWRGLRVGDRIRITHIPPEILQVGYMFHDETRALYEHLIACSEVLTVEQICEHNLPWVTYEQTTADGETVSHSLAVNDDSWELVTYS